MHPARHSSPMHGMTTVHFTAPPRSKVKIRQRGGGGWSRRNSVAPTHFPSADSPTPSTDG